MTNPTGELTASDFLYSKCYFCGRSHSFVIGSSLEMAEKRKFSDPEDIRSILEQLEEEDVYFGGENSNTGDNVELQEVASDEEASKVTVLEKLVRSSFCEHHRSSKC